MEGLKIKEFISYGSGYGYGDGYGYGSGSGSGYGKGSGYGYGYGSGSGSGSGYGKGSGYGDGYGSGDGDGYGYGSGSGSGYGKGSGYGDGYGSGKKSINGLNLHIIGSISMALTSIKGNIAKGFILNNDLSLNSCYVIKTNNLFAHGKTLPEAQTALQEKLFGDMDEDERVEMCLDLLSKCDKMVVLSEVSKGVRAEIKYCIDNAIPYVFKEEL